MANSIIKKMKGLFKMSKDKKEKTNTGSVNDNTGFCVLNDALAADADEITDALDTLDTPEGEPVTEAPVESDSIPEKTVKTEPKAVVRKEKTHERVSRIAAEMNTKGYGL